MNYNDGHCLQSPLLFLAHHLVKDSLHGHGVVVNKTALVVVLPRVGKQRSHVHREVCFRGVLSITCALLQWKRVPV